MIAPMDAYRRAEQSKTIHPASRRKPAKIDRASKWAQIHRPAFLELHNAYCEFFIRRGCVPQAVSHDHIEDASGFRNWANKFQ